MKNRTYKATTGRYKGQTLVILQEDYLFPDEDI